MAGVSRRVQFAAVVQMRWQMLLHSLRTARGSFEMFARISSQGFFALMGLGIGTGMGFAAWHFTSHNSLLPLAALLWAVFGFWQVIPIAVSSFQENADLSIFLRFPLGFGSYALFYVLFGLFDVGSLVGGIALLGVWIGTLFALPGLMGWITLALALFAAFNILLTRMIFSWIDRWLARRKSREILGGVFLFLLLAAQLANPALYQGRRHHRAFGQAAIASHLHTLERVQSFLPPGLAADTISKAEQQKPLASGVSLILLALYGAGAGALLGVRLHAEYRGENLGEAPMRAGKSARAERAGGRLQGSGPVAAVVEKEIRYLMRSGVMLYGLLAPLVIVFLFSGNGHVGFAAGFGGQFALPLGVAYSFLGLTRFIYNNLGGEGAGIQLYFLSPVPLRKVLLGKNLTHTLVFLLELTLVCVIVAFRAGLPSPQMLAVTFAWLVFAVPAQLAIGNLLSLTMAYRMNMTRLGREPGAAGNSLLSVLVQVVIFGIGAAVYLPLSYVGHANLAAPVLLALAVGAICFWNLTLTNAGPMAANRREELVSAIYRAA